MGYRRTPFAPNEWYHCFSRGIEGRSVFETPRDFERFQQLLYLANDTKKFDRATIRNLSHEEIFQLPRTDSLVSVGVYCLMGTHPHLLLQEKIEGGISKFMHKVGTAYTGYFNAKHKRIGNLLVKPFRSKHISDDRYLQRVAQYIHFNPAEIFEPGWKEGVVQDAKNLEQQLRNYAYASFPDYIGKNRPEVAILDQNAMELLRGSTIFLENLIAETQAYYAELSKEFGPRSLKGKYSEE